MGKSRQIFYGLVFAIAPTILLFVSGAIIFDYLYNREAESLKGQYIEPCIIPEGCPKEPGIMPAVISMAIAAVLVVLSVVILMRLVKTTWIKALVTGLMCVVFGVVVIAGFVGLNQSIDGNKLIPIMIAVIYLGYGSIISLNLRKK
ncbi:hypothetical protein EPO04_00145 [Patescibacteria group bacterium]|nr:MAG: hypothetical protein EPO04_00145 [Patescibacteria group bacterium]